MIPEEGIQKYEFLSNYDPFFYTLESNGFAVHVIDHMEYYNPVILYGPNGVGKSHLAYGILSDYALRNNKTIKIISAADFIHMAAYCIVSGHSKIVINYFTHFDILIIDNCFQFRGRQQMQSYLFRIASYMYDHNKPIILITEELSRPDQYFQSRFYGFETGIFADMVYPTEEVKNAYAEYYADHLKLDYKVDTLERIAAKSKTIPQIKSSLLAGQLKLTQLRTNRTDH